MGWRDLLQTSGETVVLPWVGGRSLRSASRTWNIQGKLPHEEGWYRFSLSGRSARLVRREEPALDLLQHLVRGYLVGDRLVLDDVLVDPDPSKVAAQSEPVLFIEPGLYRFARASAGRIFEDGPLIYNSLEMPLGPEDGVRNCFFLKDGSVANVPGVTPALEASFRMEVYQREEARRRREENERRLREEEAKKAEAERRATLAHRLGTAEGRRETARHDFPEAARSALAVGGAEYLDSRNAHQKNEKVVTFLFNNRRFECVCDATTLRILDAGICLRDHHTGEQGDRYFTLESLPGVIQQAQRERVLVVFRHVDENYGDPEDD